MDKIFLEDDYKHLRLSNMLEYVNVCQNCFNYYTKLDFCRQKKIALIQEKEELIEETRKAKINERLNMIMKTKKMIEKNKNKLHSKFNLTSKKIPM